MPTEKGGSCDAGEGFGLRLSTMALRGGDGRNLWTNSREEGREQQSTKENDLSGGPEP